MPVITNLDKNSWLKVNHDRTEVEKMIRPSLTYVQDAWRRLSGNKPAVLGLIVIIAFCLIAAFLPGFYPYRYSDQNLHFTNIPPKLDIYPIDTRHHIYITKEFKVIIVTPAGKLISEGNLLINDKSRRTYTYEVGGHEIVVDYSLGLKAIQELQQLTARARQDSNIDLKKAQRRLATQPKFLVYRDGEELQAKKTIRNRSYRWGSDALGRDLLIRVVYGARISLLIGFVAAFINFIIGTLYGGIAGYLGGRVDHLLMRIVDIISTIPTMLYVILLMVVLGPGLKTIILALSLTHWVNMARIVRGQVLQLKNQEYVLAAQTLGASFTRILLRHLIPNAMGPMMVALTMQIPEAIFTEAFLSFIGLGVSAPQASWGTLCNDALSGLYTYPYQLFYPALAICITLLAFNWLGDGLRDALDPKLRQ